MSAAAFEEVGLCPELIACAERAGYALPTPIQSEPFTLALTGGDVLASAETGSGKTFAFGAPVLQLVHESALSSRARRAEKAAHKARDVDALSRARCRLSANARSADSGRWITSKASCRVERRSRGRECVDGSASIRGGTRGPRCASRWR